MSEDTLDNEQGTGEDATATPNGQRKWEPNRPRRGVKSKKSFDQKKMEHLVEGGARHVAWRVWRQ